MSQSKNDFRFKSMKSNNRIDNNNKTYKLRSWLKFLE